MAGMDRYTGRWLGRPEHIRQSLGDISQTFVSERAMRGRYGISGDIIDSPILASTVARIRADVVAAINRWEPRVHYRRMDVSHQGRGAMSFTIHYSDVQSPEVVERLEVDL